MANYDLYKELHLDEDMPPSGIAEILSGRLAELRQQGYSSDSPEVDQLETAHAILGDPYKRDVYEAALYGSQDDVVNIRWLHDLADSQSPRPAATPPPSEEDTRKHSRSDVEDTRVNPAVGAEAAERAEPAEPAEAAEVERPTFTGGDADPAAGRPLPTSTPTPSSDVPSRPADEPSPAALQNSWQQPADEPDAGRQSREHSRPTPQLDTSTWGVGDRSRSESKLYLAILSVIAVGMLYPLIVLLTTSSEDMNAFVSVMKATLFAVAHVAAWVSINEIIWGVRKIVAPTTTVEK